MKLAVSNIAWAAEQDAEVYRLMRDMGFTGLEIAPTRIFKENPYEDLAAARMWKKGLSEEYGFQIPSLQSIWYGRTERLFGTENEREILIEYTKHAVDFAEEIGCRNLVFGCPRNRQKSEGADENIAVRFFREIGDYAALHNVVIAVEANPPIYNTNYINTTASAIELIETVNSPGFLLNLDIGTMIENHETPAILSGKEHLIHHVHISEPELKPVLQRDLHKELYSLLTGIGYQGYVSIEMKKTGIDMLLLAEKMKYVYELFG